MFDARTKHLLRPEYSSKHVTRVTASTLEELAGKLEGVDAAQALKTIRDYNAAVKKGVKFDPNVKDGLCTEGLAIPKSNWANPIDKPPFEAYAVTCGITFTFGGLRITTEGQVMDTSHLPIPGLYAAGEMVGGLFYFNYPGSTGLTSGAIFGRLAGKGAALAARKARAA